MQQIINPPGADGRMLCCTIRSGVIEALLATIAAVLKFGLRYH
jgi:hypothetical protein